MGQPVRHGEPSWWVLMAAIAVAAFGFSWTISGRHVPVAITLLAVGVLVAVAVRIHWRRTGRRLR